MAATPAIGTMIDEIILAIVRRLQPVPPKDAAERASAEIAAASAYFNKRGWVKNPATYHRQPPALLDSDMTWGRTTSWPYNHETVSFPSGFRPRSTEPGADRWVSGGGNDTVPVRVLRRDGASARPWVVCLHGFGMGNSPLDLTLLWANHLHETLDVNVALPVLPFHGPRTQPGHGQLLSTDLMMAVHGISQAIWDIRRLIQRMYRSGAPTVGVHGLSLGGYLAALLAGIEPVDGIVAGIPFTSMPEMLIHHRAPEQFTDILHSDATDNVFRVVSPLAIAPLAAPNRRAMFAARGDRFIPGSQSRALQRAWRSPARWYPGGHISYVWSSPTKAFVTDFLRDALEPAGKVDKTA
jgi:hypothetical protein